MDPTGSKPNNALPFYKVAPPLRRRNFIDLGAQDLETTNTSSPAPSTVPPKPLPQAAPAKPRFLPTMSKRIFPTGAAPQKPQSSPKSHPPRSLMPKEERDSYLSKSLAELVADAIAAPLTPEQSRRLQNAQRQHRRQYAADIENLYRSPRVGGHNKRAAGTRPLFGPHAATISRGHTASQRNLATTRDAIKIEQLKLMDEKFVQARTDTDEARARHLNQTPAGRRTLTQQIGKFN